MTDYNPQSLIKLKTLSMPYGKYKGVKLIDLPEQYVLWSYENQVAKGELGRLMSELYEIKVNGLEDLVRSLPTN
jgi:uncharacterized protein